MIPRLLSLGILLALALLPSGCASMDQSSDEQMQTYHSTPEQAEDAHGWGGAR